MNTKLDRLKSQLMDSGLQQKDNPLFQVVNQLISYLRQLQGFTNDSVTNLNNTSAPKILDYLTWTDESIKLPNSRNLLAGTGIAFDDSVLHERKISISNIGISWSVLTNGSVEYPELIFSGGDVIMVHVP